MQFNSIKDVEKYLGKISKFQNEGASAADFTLGRFKNFCDDLGNPQDDFPSVHIGGTNGKGSTCQILEAMYREAGFKTGVYTSPHKTVINERFVINGKRIADQELVSFFKDYAGSIEKADLTYFEITTAIAFWWFAKSEVEIAIIEVGLGGRLDATNIITPLASVITSIALDHTGILGDTLKEIAAEKAGIIKQGRPVIMGDLPAEADEVIRKQSSQKGSSVQTINALEARFIPPDNYQLTILDQKMRGKASFSAPVQAKNIAMAWQVIRATAHKVPVSLPQFFDALNHVSLGEGRFSRLTDKQRWYYDGAHNAEAVQKLKESVETVGNIDEAVLILSLMKDKIRPLLMNELSEFKKIYYYPLKLERAASFGDIKGSVKKVKPFPENQYPDFFHHELDSQLVIFAGSFYFYPTIREWINTYT